MSPPKESQRDPQPSWAIPLTESNWNPNDGGLSFLEHYRKCILEWLKKGVPKQKSLNMILAVQQKPDEDPYEFLEKIYQAYRKHTDCDPEAPENMQMVDMIFIGQSAPDIRRKLQRLDGALGMNQLVDIAFKVYNACSYNCHHSSDYYCI